MLKCSRRSTPEYHGLYGAGEEHQVRITADLDEGLVQPGQQYVGSVTVSGGDEAMLEVTVEVAD